MKVKHVLMIAAVLLAMFAAPAVADDTQQISGPQEMEIGANAGVSYSFNIPETFNFEKAEAGATKEDTVSVEIGLINPNSYVSVSVETENLWYLTHTSGSGDQLLYEMSVDGNPVANNGVVIAAEKSETKDVIFTLKESAKKAGSYKDTLTFTAEMINVIEVSDATKLNDVLTGSTASGSGNTAISITQNLDLTGISWTPASVKGYTGAGVVTINGNGNTITGLSAPLLAGGFAGESGIIIKDLTIEKSEIVSSSSQGAGAFIECVDSMQTIVLENCHLVDSSVIGNDARVGGLIGWTSGYSNINDGAVKTYVTITGCSVTGCTITGTAVGGINGHAGASDWTYTTIKDCTVTDNNLISIDDGGWRVGVVVGTANCGEVTISDITESGNTLTQDNGKVTMPAGQSNLYGRFVPSGTGKLTIDGVSITA